jgi:hypothetical protein
VHEISNGVFCAYPRRDDSSFCEPEKQHRFTVNEKLCVSLFVIEICILTQLRVVSCLLEASDSLHAANRMLVKNFIVPDPQLEGQARPYRDQSFELHIIAHGPGYATENHHRDGNDGQNELQIVYFSTVPSRPSEQKG